MEYGIDWLVTRDALIFGIGWLGVAEESIKDIALDFELKDGSTGTLPASRVRYQEVVSPLFQRTSQQRLTGFIVFGQIPGKGPPVSTWLRLNEVDGNQTRLDAPFEDLESREPLPLGVRLARRRSQARKAWLLTRRLRFRELIRRMQARRNRRPLDATDPTPFLETIGGRNRNTVLVIDHALGGGANRYRNDFVEQRLRNDDAVATLSFSLPSLQYALEVRGRDGKSKSFGLQSLDAVRKMAASSLFSEVLFNNAVSFPNPVEIPELLVDMKIDFGTRLSMTLHDYFPLCPSPYLLNWQGSYCDLPTAEVCMRCLPRNDWILFGHTLDIEEWRKVWGRAFSVADEVLCFSNSSAALLRRAFGDLPDQHIQVVPHPSGAPFERKPSLEVSGPMRIGVVGTINYHKGARLITDIAHAVRVRNLDVKITVIGTLDEPADPSIVSVTGGYERHELPRLIERAGVNVMFLPSIIPETFSYVTSELMELELPLACLDIGAPAERVRSYDLGCVISAGNADHILECLIEFHQELSERLISAEST